jgi:hypothetical protein
LAASNFAKLSRKSCITYPPDSVNFTKQIEDFYFSAQKIWLSICSPVHKIKTQPGQEKQREERLKERERSEVER